MKERQMDGGTNRWRDKHKQTETGQAVSCHYITELAIGGTLQTKQNIYVERGFCIAHQNVLINTF